MSSLLLLLSSQGRNNLAATSMTEFDSTLQEFAAHWANVNATIAPNGPFLLSGGVTRDQFIAAQVFLASASNDVIAKENAATTAGGLLETRRNALQPRVVQFNLSVRGLLPGTGYDKSLPKAPQVNVSQALFARALEDMRQLWQTINSVGASVPGFNPPLTLAGNYTYDIFNAEYTALITQAKNKENVDKDAKVSREKRNALMPGLRVRMVEYRKRLPAIVGMDSPLAASMPRITPKPGSTPSAPNLSARWDAALSKASLTWTVSASPNVTGYSVRVCTGKTYRSKDETVVGGTSPEATGFATDTGLVASGDVASFKVYALTATGNERGSLAAVVTRP